MWQNYYNNIALKMCRVVLRTILKQDEQMKNKYFNQSVLS